MVTKLALPFAGCLAQAKRFCCEFVPFVISLPGPARVAPHSPARRPRQRKRAPGSSEFAGSGSAGSIPVSTPHMEQDFWQVLQSLWAQAPACLQPRGAHMRMCSPVSSTAIPRCSLIPPKHRHPTRALKLQTTQPSSSPVASHK